MNIDLYLDLTTTPRSSNPVAIATHENELLFQIDQYDGEREIWATDGSEGGTKKLLIDTKKNFVISDGTISASTATNLYINFVSSHIPYTELYQYDGSGNVPVLIMSELDELKALYPHQNGVIIILKGDCDFWSDCDRVFYYNENDGSTIQLFDEIAGQSEFSIIGMLEKDDNAVLHAEINDKEYILFSNTNANTTEVVYQGEENSITLFGIVDDHLLFSGVNEEFIGLSSTNDGSSINNLLAADLHELTEFQWHLQVDRLLFVGDRTDVPLSQIIYSSDGESAEVLFDTQETLFSDVDAIYFFDGELFFIKGRRLFAYDGVNDPYDIEYDDSSFRGIHAVGNSLFIEGTRKVYRHVKGGVAQVVLEFIPRDHLHVFENSLLLTRDKDLYNINLNTGELEFFARTNEEVEESFPVEVESKVYYANSDLEHAIELWAFDVPSGSYEIVKDVNVGTSGRTLNTIKSLDNKMFINTGYWNSSSSQTEGLFVFDDDTKSLDFIYNKECLIERAGDFIIITDEVKNQDSMSIHSTKGALNDLNFLGKFPRTGFINSNPNAELFKFNDKALINYDGGLMVSDGTPSGTFNLTNVSIDKEFIIYKDVFYFQANQYAHPNLDDRFWRTDGTVEGTYEIFDFQVDNLYIYKDYLLVHNRDRIYFTDGTSDEFDWQWLPDIDHYFSDMDNFYVMINRELGTFPFDIPNTIDVNSSNFVEPIINIENFVNGFELNGRALFYDFWSNLFTTDGTAEGTTLLLEEFQNAFQTRTLLEHEGGLYFFHETPETGNELWVTGGTADDTNLIQDLFTGTSHSNPKSMHLFNDDLYFIATHPKYGTEIFVLDNFFSPNLTGTVYDDQNNNGIQDPDELGLPGLNVEISPNNQRTTTDEFGNYAFEIERGVKYEIEILDEDCWEYCLDEPIELDALSNPTFLTKYEVDIPACASGVDKDEFLVDFTSTIARCNTLGKHWINIKNNSCQRHAGKIEVVFDERDTLRVIDSPFDSIGGLFTFEFDELAQNEVYPIDIVVQRGNEDFTSDTLKYQIKTFLLENGEYIALDSMEERQIMRCGFDPNDKQVTPSRVEPSNSNYTQFDEMLNYKIRFQNTGNDTSFNVLITDTLSPLLDPSTFELVATSHPMTLQSRDNGILNFYFPDINLVDSLTNEPESHGFVSFTIKAIEGIGELDEIENTAHIYFDLNKAIVTNTVKNTFVEFLDMDEDGFYFYEECDDTNPDIFPGAVDIPNNGIDEDCDGEDAVTFVDSDGDGVTNETDCDDTDPNVFPGATEICNGIDDNCDGNIDEGIMLNTYYLDSDGDGFGDPDNSVEDCASLAGYVSNLDDCDDSNPNIYPGAEDIPDNDVDENCDGEDATIFVDIDGDGVTNETDCDDTDPNVYPGAAEICNDIDDNCDGNIDEGLTLITYYLDSDGDGFGDPEALIEECDIPMGYVTNLDDCDDTDPGINPEAIEIPDNGIDEDCDGGDLISSTHVLADHEVSIYPNPTKGLIYIKVDGQLEIQATLYDLSGRLISEYSDPIQINLGGLPNGSFMLKLTNLEDGQSILEKIVKVE